MGSLHIYYCHLPCSLWFWKVCQWRWLCFVMLIFLFVFFPMQFGRRTFHKWKAVPYDPKYIHAEWLRINEKHQNRLKKQLIIEQNDNSQFTWAERGDRSRLTNAPLIYDHWRCKISQFNRDDRTFVLQGFQSGKLQSVIYHWRCRG